MYITLKLYVVIHKIQLMPARVCLSNFCTRICINLNHLHLFWRFMLFLQKKCTAQAAELCTHAVQVVQCTANKG